MDQGHEVAPDGVTTYHVQAFIAGIIKKTSKGNAAHRYRNLRVYFKWLIARKHITPGNPNPMDSTKPPLTAGRDY
ncbi:site-specific recombinase XerD [Actinokineospora baliensis]|uniref:hypothetical protein n=1 Tax=Actinokineospora baliensis TaxID=547056 RepID=UPI001956F383|nr:hypothetical protein [Actinokineospora baliensis]MBM7771331.1 site-specific recombinase XerD [Actinokineospora baliensis]